MVKKVFKMTLLLGKGTNPFPNFFYACGCIADAVVALLDAVFFLFINGIGFFV